MNIATFPTTQPVVKMQGADTIVYHKAAPKRDLSHIGDEKIEACADVARRNVDSMERDNTIDGTPLPKWYSGLRAWCMQCEDEIERRNALVVDAYVAEIVSHITVNPRKPRANGGRSRTPRGVAIPVQ